MNNFQVARKQARNGCVVVGKGEEGRSPQLKKEKVGRDAGGEEKVKLTKALVDTSQLEEGDEMDWMQAEE